MPFPNVPGSTIPHGRVQTDDEGCPSRDCALRASIVINYFLCERGTKASARYCCKTANTDGELLLERGINKHKRKDRGIMPRYRVAINKPTDCIYLERIDNNLSCNKMSSFLFFIFFHKEKNLTLRRGIF